MSVYGDVLLATTALWERKLVSSYYYTCYCMCPYATPYVYSNMCVLIQALCEVCRLLILHSYFTHTLRILYSHFTHTSRMIYSGGVRVMYAADGNQFSAGAIHDYKTPYIDSNTGYRE